MNTYHKNKFDHSNCAHAWAHQLTPQGYSSNFFFDGPTIYSYGRHFPIATHYKGLVFFTLKGYSKSTAKHKSRALSAVSHLPIIYVEHVPVLSGDGTLNADFADRNINTWIKDMVDLAKLFQAHPRRKSLITEVEYIKNRLQAFLDALDIQIPGQYIQILEDPGFSAINAFVENERRIKAELEQNRLEKAIADFDVQLQLWESGENNWLNPHPSDANLAYLRLDASTEHIETSKEIKIPLPVAKRFWRYVQDELRYPDTNKDGYEIMGFPVKEITEAFIIVGCHKVPMQEAEKMASRLGWL